VFVAWTNPGEGAPDAWPRESDSYLRQFQPAEQQRQSASMPGIREPQLHRLLKRAESLLDLQLQVLDTVLQVAHGSKDVSKQHLMMQPDLPGPRLLEFSLPDTF
jgi:hypothetical protein